jgi:hypothetical protein
MSGQSRDEAVDIAIIGAGSAGIAAARLCRRQAPQLTCRIYEARDRLGGRATTSSFFGQPIDLAAHWMHMEAANPLVTLAAELGIATIPAPTMRPTYVDGKKQDRAETAPFRQAWEQIAAKALSLARADADLSVADCLPAPGPWSDAIAFSHGLYCGRAVEEVSAFDYARVEESSNRFPRGGYGTVLAALTHGLAIRSGVAIDGIDWSGEQVRLVTGGSGISARATIVTVPVMVLQAGGVSFSPRLPSRHAKAIGAFLRGCYEHVIIRWPDSPFDDGPDQLTLFKGSRTRSISMLTRIEGSDFHYVEIGGPLLTEFQGSASQKKTFSVAFVQSELRRHFGSAACANIEIIHVTDWWNDPFSLGSWSVAPPGHALAREALQESVGGLIWFAGEACSPKQWGTAGGAWIEGERAALAVLEHLAE